MRVARRQKLHVDLAILLGTEAAQHDHAGVKAERRHDLAVNPQLDQWPAGIAGAQLQRAAKLAAQADWTPLDGDLRRLARCKLRPGDAGHAQRRRRFLLADLQRCCPLILQSEDVAAHVFLAHRADFKPGLDGENCAVHLPGNTPRRGRLLTGRLLNGRNRGTGDRRCGVAPDKAAR